MKLILDEWIVREVIDTLYMASMTFLGITGLDSPQEVAKKSANETSITRRISKAIDIIQQSEQQPMPESLEEAAEEYATTHLRNNEFPTADSAFIAGAKWDRKQMLRGAKDGYVSAIIIHNDGDEEHYAVTYPNGERPHSITDKVKIIIL